MITASKLFAFPLSIFKVEYPKHSHREIKRLQQIKLMPGQYYLMLDLAVAHDTATHSLDDAACPTQNDHIKHMVEHLHTGQRFNLVAIAQDIEKGAYPKKDKNWFNYDRVMALHYGNTSEGLYVSIGFTNLPGELPKIYKAHSYFDHDGTTDLPTTTFTHREQIFSLMAQLTSHHS